MQAFTDYQAGRLGAIPAIATIHNTPATVVESGQPPEGQPSEA
jgi:hypothetical protein